MESELFLSKALNATLVLGFFAAVIFFLRWLYGPGGKLRDPEWDVWNEEADKRRAEARRAARDAALIAVFKDYARRFFGAGPDMDAHLQLKIEHTLRVYDIAAKLAACEEALNDPDVAVPLKLAALFHDVGRFEQLRRYNTFSDQDSCNHGHLGARLIVSQGFLKDETPEVRKIVIQAVADHNRPAVPQALRGKRRLVLEALRDADKADILNLVSEHLAPGKSHDAVVLMHLADEPGQVSPAILDALEAGCIAKYADMRFVNDFRVVLCTWVTDLHFATTFEIIKGQGSYARILAGLEGVPEVRAKAEALVMSRLGV